MSLFATHRFRSLKAKFVGLLLLGGVTAGALGGWITYQATHSYLQERLLIRVDTLASALNHAAMVTSDWLIVQHMIEEVTRDLPDITDIMVVGKTSGKIEAASMAPFIGLSIEKLPDEHLRQELLDALHNDYFGYHFEPDKNRDLAGNLVVIAPLAPAIDLKGGHGAHGQHSHDAHAHPVTTAPSAMAPKNTPAHSHDAGAQRTHNHHQSGPLGTTLQGAQRSMIPVNRGAILISVSRNAVERGASDVLLRFLLADFAAIAVILLIAYVALEYQVLSPIKSIHSAISRRKSGDSAARVSLQQHDEIAAVAQTLNETLDKEDEQIEALSGLLNQNEELRGRLQSSSNRVVEINERYLHRIGADLHDGPAQLIAFALLRLDSLKSTLRNEYPDREGSNEISAVYEALHDAMREIRELSAGLTLAKLEEMSPLTVLNEIVGAHERRTETSVKLNVDSIPDWLPLPVKITAFRFIQEGLNNAYDHAGGIDQAVSCKFDGHELQLEVTDGGAGFVPETAATSGGGLGLIGLRERIENLGGKLQILSVPGKGTRLTMWCRVNEDELVPV
jgi:signal transduction histidine kinase